MKSIKYLIILISLLFVTIQCKKETPEISKPWIDRGEYNPEIRTATSKMTGGGEYIIERGHAWGLNPNPSPENSSFDAYENAENTVDTITIITEITNLVPDSIIYLRAYAIDKFSNHFFSENSIIIDPSTFTNACFSISNDECEISECFIDFDATCSENIIEYRWDFDGDGTFELVGGDKQAVSYEYVEAGAYDVKLQTVSLEGIVDNMVQTVQTFVIGGALIPCFTTSTTDAELDQVVYFDAFCSENAVKYQWDLDGDGTFEISGSDQQLVNHPYTEIGTYNPTLRVENVHGIVETTTDTITVSQAFSIDPTACFTTSTTDAELYQVVYFDAFCSENAVDYQWDLDGDGTFEISGSDQQFVNQPYTEIGTYNPTLRVENIHGIVETTMDTIRVSQAISIDPIACFSSNENVAEVNETIYFDASCSENAVNYKWDFDGDGIFEITGSNLDVISHIYTDISMYGVTLEVENIHGVTDVMTIPIEITEAISVTPIACFSVNTTNAIIGETIYFDASCSENAINYKWDFDGDGVFEISGIDQVIVNHTYSDTSIYNVRLEVENVHETTHSTVETINITEPISIIPEACFDIVGTGVAEIGQSMYFDASCSEDEVEYKWDFGDGMLFISNDSEVANHTYTTSGDYNVTLTVKSTDQSESTPFSQSVVINLPPTDTITFLPTSIEYICPIHVGGGDREFSSNGPDVNIECEAVMTESEINLYVRFHLIETQSNYTEGEFIGYINIYTAENGKKIKQILSDVVTNASYTDNDNGIDIIPGEQGSIMSGGHLVNTFHVVGDTDGDDIDGDCSNGVGYASRLSIYFNPMTIELENW